MDEVGGSGRFPLWSVGGVLLLIIALIAGVLIGIWNQKGPYAELESELASERSAVEELSPSWRPSAQPWTNLGANYRNLRRRS